MSTAANIGERAANAIEQPTLLVRLPGAGSWDAAAQTALEAGAIVFRDAAGDPRHGVRSTPSRPAPETARRVLLGAEWWLLDDAAARIAHLLGAGVDVWAEVTSAGEAERAVAAGAQQLVVCGLEGGGLCGESSTLVLVRQVVHATPPSARVVARGGIGPDGAAACIAAGADGVLLDCQLWLASESPAAGPLAALLRGFNPLDTACIGLATGFRYRVFGQVATRSVKALVAMEASAGVTTGDVMAAIEDRLRQDPCEADKREDLLPIGQDAALADVFVDRWGTIRGMLDGVRQVIRDRNTSLAAEWPWKEGEGIARTNGTRLPLHQGPMAQVSDTPAFARAVVDAGAMPWLALGNMPPEVAERTVTGTREACGALPFGAGIIGLDANPHRDAHIRMLKEQRPPAVLVAAGTIEQAHDLESAGLQTWLHTPTPGLLRAALANGISHFILEGAEAGGHVGHLGGLVLWQLGIIEVERAIRDGRDPAGISFVTAGGLGDAASSRALAAMVLGLHRQGVRVGMQMGTAYLFCREAVETGALSAIYPEAARQSRETVLMGETVRTPTRVLRTPQAAVVLDREKQRFVHNEPLRERKEAYEHDNLGGLRAAAKAQRIESIDPERGAVFADLDREEQLATGLFHAGQGAGVGEPATDLASLHQTITAALELPLERAAATGTDRASRPASAPVAPSPARASTAPALPAERAQIAIVGLGAVLPDAPSVEAFWDNLKRGHCAIGEVPRDRWDSSLYWSEDRAASDRSYSRIGAFVKDFVFDRRSFRIPPTVVQSLDQAQQMALEAARQVFAEAPVLDDPRFDRERCAVIVGNSNGADRRIETTLRCELPGMVAALQKAVADESLTAEQATRLEERFSAHFLEGRAPITEDTMPGELPNCIAGRLAGVFDLGGPNWVTDAACASSLAAIHVAVDGLRAGTFDAALAGGVDSLMGPEPYIKFSRIGALSADGSRPFDASANGFVMGEGCGLMLLMRRDDAERLGLPIHAVIRGVGASSDGRGKGITAPNPKGQVRAIHRAWENAGLDPASLTMLEAHGTATPVGDPVEIGSVRDAIGRLHHGASLGSVKSNIGHLKAAAGAAGLIKATLCLREKTLVPTLGVTSPNPAIPFEETGLALQQESAPWHVPAGVPRRAAVSAFGFGGTNLHVVLEEADGASASRGDWAASSTSARGSVAPTPAIQATAQPVAVVPPVSAPASSAQAGGRAAVDEASVLARVVEVLCDRTGYDPEEIEADFELEADLGVDTVKQAEIMAQVREEYALAKDPDFRLAEHPTLRALAEYVVARSAAGSAPVPVVADAGAASARTAGAVDEASVLARVVEVLCDRTGYDPEEIEADFELEADLGVDTVKQAEIMAQVREEYALAKDPDFRLAEHPTLRALAEYVVARSAMGGGMVAAAAAGGESPSADGGPETWDETRTTIHRAAPAAAPAAAAAEGGASGPSGVGAVAASTRAVAAVDEASVLARVVEVLCDRTGYDPEEIEADFELEADLGVDTVKQAEIMAQVREEYALAKDPDFRLAEHPTLRALAEYVVVRSAMGGAGAESAAESTSDVGEGASAGGGPEAWDEAPTTIHRTGQDGAAGGRAVAGQPMAVGPVTAEAGQRQAGGSVAGLELRQEGGAGLVHVPEGVVLVGAADGDALADALQGLATAVRSGGASAAAAHGVTRAALDAPVRVAVAFDPADGATLVDSLERAAKAARTGKGWRLLQQRGVAFGEGRPEGKVAFLFPGQGTQYLGMLRELREHFPVVRQTLAEADEVMTPLLGGSLSSMIDPGEGRTEEQAGEDFLRLTRTEVTQPAVLTVDVAMLRLLEEFGWRPEMTIGHSLGEYGACVASGVMSFADALRTVAQRGTAMASAQPRGGDPGWMIAVPAPAERVEELLARVEGYAVCANRNSPTQTIVAGETSTVRKLQALLEEEGIPAPRLPVSHAFHTEIVAAASAPLREHLSSLALAAPEVPLVSNLTGGFYPSEREAIVDMLARQVAAPVEFIKGIETMYAAGARAFVEVGPKRAQTGFVEAILEGRPHLAVFTNHPKSGELASFRAAIARMLAWGRAPEERPEGQSEKRPEVRADESVAHAPEHDVRGSQAPRVSSDATRGLAWHPGGEGGPEDTRWSVEAEVVCTGTGIGLPGTAALFDEEGVDRLFRGENLIDPVSEDVRGAMLAKRITRLEKGEDGTAHFVPVTKLDEVIHLAGQSGTFDPAADYGIDERMLAGLDRASRLALAAGIEALRDAGIPLVPAWRETRSGKRLATGWTLPESLRDDTGIVYASAFAGVDRVLAEAHSAATDPDWKIDGRWLLQTIGMGHARLAEHIGARGPNTRLNAACASTTQAISIAEDWLRLGRCRRVLVVAADDVTEPRMMEWVGSAFLATGAATAEKDVERAALPFDRRRNGTLLGMGAVGIVLERAEDASRRGVVPVADLLGTRLANSAGHPTRLDVDHIASEVGRLLGETESRFGVQAAEMAPHMVFVSHETYTPARGGSAAAEIESLRRNFGEHASEIVIGNTKGYTGHAMGAGFEDAIGIRMLQRGEVPALPNLREPDERLGDLRLSKGGAHDVDYALRLAAGFGSHLALGLWRRRARGRDRVVQRVWERWVREVSGFADPDVFVEQRTLRVREARPERTVEAPSVSPAPAPVPSGINERVTLPGPEPAPASAETGADFPAPFVVREVVPGTLVPISVDAALGDLRGQRVAIVAEDVDSAASFATAVRDAGAEAHESSELDLLDEAAVEAWLGSPGHPFDMVVNLVAVARGDGAEEGRAAARRAFHLARAWARHCGGTPGEGKRFVTVTTMGWGDGSWRAPEVGGGASGLTKTLAREWPDASVRVVDVAASRLRAAAALVLAAGVAPDLGLEVAVSGEGVRQLVLRPWSPAPGTGGPPADAVWLLTGGGRGITARVAHALAERFGGHFVLTGRTELVAGAEAVDLDAERERIRTALKATGARVTPMAVARALRPIEASREIAQTIARLRAAGATAEYAAFDVCDRAEVERVVSDIRSRFSRLDVCIHGAGLMENRMMMDKDPAIFDRVFRAKVIGAENLIAALRAGGDGGRFIGFGSVAGRFGNAGQVDYAAANDALSRMVRTLGGSGDVTGLCVDWSAWAEVGMATRGSTQTVLEKLGVDTLPPDVGAEMLCRLVEADASGEVVASGRLGAMESGMGEAVDAQGGEDAAKGVSGMLLGSVERRDERSLRADVPLDPQRQAFLDDHRIGGTVVVPGVFGMELFAQAAQALVPASTVAGFAGVEFVRPVKLHEGREVHLFVEAELAEDGRVRARLKSVRKLATGREREEEHFRGEVLLGGPGSSEALLVLPEGEVREGPDREAIYARYFHTGVFRVVERAWFVGERSVLVEARQPEAELAPGVLAPELVSDPMVREMALQASGLVALGRTGRQFLPAGMDEVHVFGHAPAGAEVVVRAVETGVGEHDRTYDVDVCDASGRLLQRIRGSRMIDTGVAAGEPLPIGEPLAHIAGTMGWQDAEQHLTAWSGGPVPVWNVSTLAALFGEEELGSWARLKSVQRKTEWLTARVLLREMLRGFWSRWCGVDVPATAIGVRKDEYGAPSVVLTEPWSGTIPAGWVPAFSMAHSAGRAEVLLAWPGQGIRPGVDIEVIESRTAAFLDQYFGESERSLAVPGAADEAARATALWSIKESVSKALGRGLHLNTREIVLTAITGDGTAEVVLEGEAAQVFASLGGRGLTARVEVGDGFVRSEASLRCRVGEPDRRQTQSQTSSRAAGVADGNRPQ